MTANQHEDAVRVATPPTPDPRERGEALAVAIIASEIGDAIAAHDSGENVSPETRARHVVAALRAPAPSEAVAWQRCPVCDGHGYLGYPKGVAPGQSFFDSSTGNYPCHACNGRGALATHPAPARGVTVTEAMVADALFRAMLVKRDGLALRFAVGEMHDLTSDIPRIAAHLTAILTPDAP